MNVSLMFSSKFGCGFDYVFGSDAYRSRKYSLIYVGSFPINDMAHRLSV